jgi:hypothetical protein
MQILATQAQDDDCEDMHLLAEATGLEGLHRSLTRRVSAWRLAHGAAAQSGATLLRRMDALIAALERR